MSAETAKMIAFSVVSLRLDYCNFVLPGMLDANCNKLERVQYALARVVTGMFAYSRHHMTPVFVKLHWLPIRTRVSFKIATMVFKIRQTKLPSYLAELIEDVIPPRTLRSSVCRQVTLKESKTVGHWCKSFPLHSRQNVELFSRQSYAS